MQGLNQEQEADRLLKLYGTGRETELMGLIERQFQILHHRAQVLLGLCGIVITTTGFSGRMIAGTNRAGQVLIILGVGLTLSAAALVVQGVLPLRWLSQQPGDIGRPWLMQSLSYRDRKTQHYRVAIRVLMVGLTLYVAAIAVMLLNPNASVAVPGR